ncbi:hypothetical protein AVEN_9278-1 [Araneus ventricosus]|uniref:Uncharacterized protein n=1 Tax=Araneus ventricosus TaxID=182803 RepID=A0A4Y2SDB3_ARAVE|nr:hypothetical protein AVEN_9278-1 [Araneus ventricosus]
MTKFESSLGVEQDSQLSRVPFKTPIFWENDPQLWFHQVKSQLVIAVCKASLDEVAQIEDKIHEVPGCNLTVAWVEFKPECVELEAIRAELADLKNMVGKLFFLDIPSKRSLTPSRRMASKM